MTGAPDGAATPPAVTCVVRLRYDTAAVAGAVAESLAPDDGGYITTEVRGTEVLAEASAPDIMALVHTLEDFLSCASAAEKVASSLKE